VVAVAAAAAAAAAAEVVAVPVAVVGAEVLGAGLEPGELVAEEVGLRLGLKTLRRLSFYRKGPTRTHPLFAGSFSSVPLSRLLSYCFSFFL
jgi:hypothetical protein